MYQTCIVVGYLAGDAEMRYTPSGTAVTNFSIPVDDRWTDREGQQQERTTWFRVAVWGRQAEAIQQYLVKGKQVLVEGSVDASAYTAQDGTPRARLDLRARNVRLLGSRGDGGGGGGGGYDDGFGGRQGGERSEESGGDWMSEPQSSGNRPAPSNRRPSQPPRSGGGGTPQQPETDEDIPF